MCGGRARRSSRSSRPVPTRSPRTARSAPREPEYENLPFTSLGRNRAALIAVAGVGLALFFTTWAVNVTGHDATPLSGPDIAGNLKPLWIACVSWFLLIPTVLSRRSIMQMRGARVAVASLGVLPGILAGSLLVNRPDADGWTTIHIAWPVYATLALSVVALVLAGGVRRPHRGRAQGGGGACWRPRHAPEPSWGRRAR